MMGAVFHSVAATWIAQAVPRLIRRILSRVGAVRSVPVSRPPSPWLAGSVHRWHTNPAFCATGDRVDGHSARVALLIL